MLHGKLKLNTILFADDQVIIEMMKAFIQLYIN
jgi:hypothetical protein